MKNKNLSIRGMVYASMFGAATAVGAYVMIPLPPVPITLQTLILSLAAALLGGIYGALSQVVYVLMGLMGLPVFAGGKAGFGVLFGPTGGYLIGFIAGAYVIGEMISMKTKPGFLWTALSILSGTLVIYFIGVLQLSFVANLSIAKSISLGVLPFLAGDMIKMIVATILFLKLRDKIDLKGIRHDYNGKDPLQV